MLRTLYGKLAIGLVVLMTATGGFYIALTSFAMRHYLRDIHLQLNHDLARNLVADRNLVAEGKLNKAALKETFRKYMVINPSIEIYLLDLQGRILSYSADPGKVKRKRVSLAPIRAFLDMKRPGLILGDDPRSHDKQKVFSVTPVPSGEKPQGYLYVVLRGEQFDSAEQSVRDSYLWKVGGWTLAASLALGLLAGLIAFYLLTRRLRELSRMMNRFALAHALPAEPGAEPAGDEIEQLSRAFRRMARRIDEQLDSLRAKDSQRRRFVAQISHDLRTPLSSLLGYLESLQIKEESLAPEQRRAFLETAMRQGKSLQRLVEALFELSSLEAQESAPEREPFSVAELIHDTVQKHRLKAGQLKIELRVHAAPDLPFALGDVGLTERALDNLLDNAFSHAGGDGHVDISARMDEERIAVAVRDDGPGIPEDARARIFDPRFRLHEDARGERHAGLGLAIAKRCIELQGGDIRLESGPNAGACFVFRLPAAP